MGKFVKMIILSAVIFVLTACSSEINTDADTASKAAAEKKNEGDFAQEFDLEEVKGNTYRLSDYEGKKVYIKFWASWCPICLAGLEELNELSGEKQDFVVLTVVAPGYNNEKDSESFKKWFNGVENTSNIIVLLDKNGSITKKYNVRGYPTSAYIGSDGVLVKTQPGHVSNEQIKNEFENIE